jgi:CubicO group peptidase (beta-lactamase class C family)
MSASASSHTLAGARAFAERLVADGRLPSLVFGVADATGRTEVVAVAGPGHPARRDSVYFLASISKAIVATAVMRYADEGRWDLRAPLSRYIPGYAGDGREAVSAWHVLTHTSGLPDIPLESLRRQRPGYARLVGTVRTQVPRWTPGSRYEYSSSAWVLLAEAMASLSSMSFPRALDVRLTAPLGMADTTFDARRMRPRVMRVAGVGAGNRAVDEVLLRFLARATMPGGGLFGTVDDLLRLGRSLLPPDGAAGPRVLSESAIEAMAAPQTSGIPHIAEDGSRTEVAQALGWRRPGPGWPPRERVITHGGISGSRLWIDREAGLVFALLTNLWQAPDEPVIELLESVYAERGRAG